MSTAAPELSIIIPAYNEASRLPATLRAIAGFFSIRSQHPRGVVAGQRRAPQGSRDQLQLIEVIVADDGSTDGSSTTFQYLTRTYPLPLRIEQLPTNQGKGSAVRAGVRAASGEWLLIMDADSSTPITELPRLWAKRDKAPIILGSRYLPGSSIARTQSLPRQLISRTGNVLIRLLVGLQLTDTQNGFKLMRADVAKPIFAAATIDRWGFDIEILAQAHHQGHKILEVPVAWSDAAGSKLRAGRDAWRTFQELLRIRRQLRASTKIQSVMSK